MLNLSILADIPILAYHKISDKKEIGLTTVSPDVFKSQMTILSESGFESITFKQVTDKKSLPEKPVIIVFDDGYESVFKEALPVMNAFGYNGVVYIVTDYIGKYNTWEAASWQQKFAHLSAEQIKYLQDDGFEIGSHGKTHRYLTAMTEAQIEREVNDSKKYLEDLTGEEVISFCYPFGRYSTRVRRIVGEAGYRFAIHNLILRGRKITDPLALMRRSIYLTDKENTFLSKLNLPYKLSGPVLWESTIQKGALLSIAIKEIKQLFEPTR